MVTAPSQLPSEGDPGPACLGRTDELDDDTWEMPALPGECAALEALRWHWGEVYEIGVDDGQWWYRRRDGKGGTETAATPDELRAMIITDYTIMPVPREPSPGRTTPTATGQPTPTEPTTP
ncbi:MAG TPA: hypothetical protein VKS82_08820 [Streptosporangiaceae bacterium]|nr:hypothetical protein [Streptosporangiaceae bacterium]